MAKVVGEVGAEELSAKMWPKATSSRPIPEQIGGDGLLLQHHESEVFDGWSAHVRYFLARYPLETRKFVAQVRSDRDWRYWFCPEGTGRL